MSRLILVLVLLSLAPLSLYKDNIHTNYLMRSVGASVVMLTPINNPQAGGTGFQIETPYGNRLISNAHVCRSLGEYGLAHYQGGQQIVKIERLDDRADLCMLSAVYDIPALELASSKAEVGDTVRALGHPGLRPQTMTEGVVIGTDITGVVTGFYDEATCVGPGAEQYIIFCVRPYNAVNTTVTIYPGSSGSPVFNKFGNVQGVMFASNNQTNQGSYMPLADLQRFIQEERSGL